MGEVGITNSALRQRVMDKVQDTDTDTDTDKYGIPPGNTARPP